MKTFSYEIVGNQLVSENGEILEGIEIAQAVNDAEAVLPPNIFMTFGELMSRKRGASWVIRGFLQDESTAVIYGESGAGKSFLALDMALCVAIGHEWHGQKVKQGAVFYICGEGNNGISQRARAWSLANDLETPDTLPLFCSHGAVVLPDEKTLANLMGCIDEMAVIAGHEPRLVIIDTFARNFDGEENSAKDVGGFIQALDKIKAKYKCCVLTVHHSGKDSTRGARGSTALKAAMETEICLSIDNVFKRLSVSKLKNDEPPPDMLFTLDRYPTDWLDDDGEIITSAVLRLSDETPLPKGNKAPRLSARDEHVFKVISATIQKAGIDCPNDIVVNEYPDSKHLAPKKVTQIACVRGEAEKHLNVAEKAKRTTFDRTIEKLSNAGKIKFYNGYLWILTP